MLKNAPPSQGQRNLLLVRLLTTAALVSASPALAQERAGNAAAPAGGEGVVNQEIIVTAQKKRESIIDVPASVTVMGAATLANFNIKEFADYATKIPNLSFSIGSTTGGYTRGRQIAIRGIGGSNTTSLYIDDTPVTDSIDPHLVDIDRIEVLKGPQGTLFGENSLGGAVRFVTSQPDSGKNRFAFMFKGGATLHGGSGNYGGEVSVNQMLVPDKMAIRASAYYTHDAGFVTRTYPIASGGRASVDDQGASRFYGGSIALLYEFDDNFSITLGDINQNKEVSGLPIAYAPLPLFKPVSYTSNRVANVDEGFTDRWNLAYGNLRYQATGFSLTSSTSYFKRRGRDRDDGTEATLATLSSLGFTPPAGTSYQWRQFNNISRFTQEVRLAFEPIGGFSGVVGTYYSREKTHGGLPAAFSPGLQASGSYSSNLLYQQDVYLTSSNLAAFGELYYKIDGLTLTAGGRVYKLKQSSNVIGNGFFNGGPTATGLIKADQTGALPKAAIAYQVTKDVNVYLLYSQGYRPGGPNTALPATCDAELAVLGTTRQGVQQYNADTTKNYEAGAKASLFSGRAYASVAAFQIDWDGIQQRQRLRSCGFSYTGNAGAARSRGIEAELNGEVTRGLSLRLGAAYNKATITKSGASPQPVGSRVFNIPKVTLTAGFHYVTPEADGRRWFVSADTSYISNSLSGTFNSRTPLIKPSYDVTNFRAGVDFGASEVSIFVDNIFNTKANLGDVTPISFAETATIGGVTSPRLRVGLLRPTTVGVQFRHGF